uniref:MANSC domain-containing protein n=1 Tax=Periophthalmus magnuspinnatus TaxID=409849 RepID=A0A3B4AIQ9_9GOBI
MRRETLFHCVNKMALLQHHQLLPLACALLLSGINRVDARSSQISDLKSKISGVEELLDEFRKQLQQEQAYNRASDVTDSCVGDYDTAEARIIRTRLSIEQGATFLLAPDTVYTWRDCLHACCSLPHCTVAVVQENPRQAGESLGCFLFNCTYRGRNHCPDRSDEDFCPNLFISSSCSIK